VRLTNEHAFQNPDDNVVQGVTGDEMSLNGSWEAPSFKDAVRQHELIDRIERHLRQPRAGGHGHAGPRRRGAARQVPPGVSDRGTPHHQVTVETGAPGADRVAAARDSTRQSTTSADRASDLNSVVTASKPEESRKRT
jgi:hypothetical protein